MKQIAFTLFLALLCFFENSIASDTFLTGNSKYVTDEIATTGGNEFINFDKNDNYANVELIGSIAKKLSSTDQPSRTRNLNKERAVTSSARPKWSDEMSVTASGGAPAITGTVYYVSNSGSDSNNGLSPETAWQTLGYVAEQSLLPGDAVLFRRGDTWRETLNLWYSGTSVAWISYGTYGTGNKPRFLGSEKATGWNEVGAGTNIWRSSTTVLNPYNGGYSYAEIFFEHSAGVAQWGRQRDTLSSLTQEFDWYWNANNIYVYSPSDPATRYYSVEVPQRASCITFPAIGGWSSFLGHEIGPDDYVNYISFDNLEIMYAYQRGIYAGYREIEAHGVRVAYCHIGYIGIKGGASAYGIADWHSDAIYQNNVIHDCGRRGISINTYQDAIVRDLVISNVTIDHNYFYNGFHTTGPDISSELNNHKFVNFTISNNIVDDTGINEIGDHLSSNSIYVESKTEIYENFYVFNNVVIGSTARALLLVGIDNLYVYHNTIYGSHPDAQPYHLVAFGSKNPPLTLNIDMRNNIIHGTLPDSSFDARCVFREGDSTFALRNYNLYYQDDPAQPITGANPNYGAESWDYFMSDWNDWRTTFGWEQNSPNPADPLFIDPDNANFRLQPGSTAIGSATPISLVTNDILGNPRNPLHPTIGAYEYKKNIVLQTLFLLLLTP